MEINTSSMPFTSSSKSNGNVCDAVNSQQVEFPSPFLPPSLRNIWQGSDTTELTGSQPHELRAKNIPAIPHEPAIDTVDDRDLKTPDEWIPRDKTLVRLTGNHPFNCEPRLKDLYNHGFLTPARLFFVRNHGAVPKVTEDLANKWTLDIQGLCSNPVTLTLKDLSKMFEVVTIPVTLVCAGNRRKEQNVVQKSLGFSWGAAGLSTALFTGVHLADILQLVSPIKGARHVVFEGGDSLPNGPYGTSQRLSWARDRKRGMLISWAMNGLPLEPDHGFPLRLVVPGQIGGRSVKWLKKIEISENESQHHLHFHDNKVLPMPLGPDQARKEKDWWYDPRYIITELNVNSAVACPDHDEILDCKSPTDVYTIKGYAYAGGGNRVTRVEMSLDDGNSWSLTEITYPEDTFREDIFSDPIYGRLDLTESDTCFCWSFWSLNVPIGELQRSDVIIVRAMDESLALQPRNMYWNATGMMNNWWFRVRIHHLEGDKLQFEHPTMAGAQPGGWMQRMKDQGLDPSKPVFSNVDNPPLAPASQTPHISMAKPGVNRKVTAEELALHRSVDSTWFAVNGEVYDATSYLEDHPGGASSILIAAGQDASEDFLSIHSSDAKMQLAHFHIGTLVGAIAKTNDTSSSPTQTDNPKQNSGLFLLSNKWRKVRLRSVRDVSSDSKIFRFQLEHPDQELGLPIGQHVYARLKRHILSPDHSKPMTDQTETVQRAYTPISRWEDKGWVDLLIKIYYPCAKFPSGGKMSLEFSRLAVDEEIELKGPIGEFVWKGENTASIHGQERKVREIGLVCGGSGITPILQVARGILGDSSTSEAKVWILDSNRKEEDILCREELDRLVKEHDDRCRIHYTLTGEPIRKEWEYSTGRITKKMISRYLPAPGPDNIVGLCGPRSMEQGVKDMLQKDGWNLKNIIIF